MDWRSESWQFETDRLRIDPWRAAGDEALARFLVSSLTPEVTGELPTRWQLGVQPEQASAWIDEQDARGAMFAIEVKTTGELVGLFMFFVLHESNEPTEVRVGYVLAKQAWGHGYASEVVAGFARLWDLRAPTARLLAGVNETNRPSRRVLEKAGFDIVSREHQGDAVVLTYERLAKT